jgi:hypothetical protein
MNKSQAEAHEMSDEITRTADLVARLGEEGGPSKSQNMKKKRHLLLAMSFSLPLS